MDCNYDKCPAKIHLEAVNKRLDSDNAEFEQMRKDAREANKRIAEIANNQTKLSSDLVLHMNRSEDKHTYVIKSIENLSSTIDKQITLFTSKIEEQSKSLKEHTDEEMIVQQAWQGKIESLSDNVKDVSRTVKLIVGGVTVVGLFLWDYIKPLADSFIKSLLGI